MILRFTDWWHEDTNLLRRSSLWVSPAAVLAAGSCFMLYWATRASAAACRATSHGPALAHFHYWVDASQRTGLVGFGVTAMGFFVVRHRGRVALFALAYALFMLFLSGPHSDLLGDAVCHV